MDEGEAYFVPVPGNFQAWLPAMVISWSVVNAGLATDT
jgi:hypothetical protein